MLIRDVMHYPVETVAPQATLAEAYRIMQQKGFRHLPVVEAGRLVGIVTDRDLRLATSALHPHPFPPEARVADVMQRRVITAAPHDPIEEAARLMRLQRIGCLPVLEGEVLIGMVTATDLLEALLRLTGADQPSGRLEVQLAHLPGRLAALATAIAAQQVNVLSILSYAESPQWLRVVLRVDTNRTHPLAEALRREGFDVIWPPRKPWFPSSTIPTT
jgi:acetoin utilization protein AcuB